jgi:CSLREA domain-containing protein
MMHPTSMRPRSLLIMITVLALALPVLLFKTDRALMMSGVPAPLAPMLAGISVNTTVDEDNTNPAACSLREAIVAANTNAAYGGCTAGSGEDIITFAVTPGGPGCMDGVCTIALASTLPDLTTSMSITGPGANLLAVQRSEAPGTPLFSIFRIAQNVTVAISSLTLSNADSSENGGAIRNFGSLTLTGLSLFNNHTSAAGSAIFNTVNGTVTLTNSTLWENTAGGGPESGFAAIYNQGITVSIINSTLAGNRNLGNMNNAPGSAIFNESNSITHVTNCTISENFGQGAAVFQNGGIDASGKLNLKNSIVAGNATGNTSGVTDKGNNLIDGSPLLGPLQDNGGPTVTKALLSGSPALDAATDFTTLNGAIDNSVTTINVTDGASIPAGVGFILRIDSEQMVVTSKVSNTLTVTRGANATTAASHAGGAGVNPAFDQRGASFPRKADGPDANTTQTLDIGAFEADASVEDISDKSTNEDVALPTFTFNVGDAATPFNNIIATSSDPDLVPNGNIVVGPDTASTRTLSITPAANQSGFAIILVTVVKGAQSMSDFFFLTVNPVADTPSVSNATTSANTQTTSGLVISRNPADGPEVTHFKITGITGGTLFKNNGTTQINNGDFITFAEGNAGLKFTPGTSNGSFTVQASVSASDAGLGGGTATATITVNPLGGVIRFSAANYSVAEGAGFTTITVERTGDTSLSATVDYASSDHSNPADFIPCTSPGVGFASSRCDFTTAIGTLRFAAGETSKTFNVLISQDNYVEGPETLELTLSNPTAGAVLGVPAVATLEIVDDVSEPATNPIDTSSWFVRSQYHDFLNREPDAPGLAFWTDNIEQCNDPARIPAGQTVAQCIDKQRESTAIAFFMSPEFQMTGGFVYHLYKGSLTGVPNYDGGSPGRFPTFLEFTRDVRQVSEGIVVNNQISGAVVEANRNRLAAEFVLRPEFVAKYGGLNDTLYVQELFNTTGITPTAAEKQALVDGLTNGTETKATVLRKIVDGTVVISEGNVQFTTTYGQAFYNQEYRRVFVYMEYVGYLRRNPDAAGFNFWLGKLNLFNGDPFQAEMVRAFILSPEYRSRFGTP